jgi:hypothetical protein
MWAKAQSSFMVAGSTTPKEVSRRRISEPGYLADMANILFKN